MAQPTNPTTSLPKDTTRVVTMSRELLDTAPPWLGDVVDAAVAQSVASHQPSSSFAPRYGDIDLVPGQSHIFIGEELVGEVQFVDPHFQVTPLHPALWQDTGDQA